MLRPDNAGTCDRSLSWRTTEALERKPGLWKELFFDDISDLPGS